MIAIFSRVAVDLDLDDFDELSWCQMLVRPSVYQWWAGGMGSLRFGLFRFQNRKYLPSKYYSKTEALV